MKENKALFEEILNQQPGLHVSASGGPISWAVSPDVLRYPFDEVPIKTALGLQDRSDIHRPPRRRAAFVQVTMADE